MSGEESKYDRQLRLWGQDGQQALTASRAVVLGATATSAELLKNLVLPGIGHFTIVDDVLTGSEAMGHNFFVNRDDYVTQRPIAEAIVQNLTELNPHSVGHACVESCASWIRAFVNGFLSNSNEDPKPNQAVKQKEDWPTIVIATPRVTPVDLRILATYLSPSGTPLLFVQSVGLCGLLLVQCGERLLIHAEPKPETRVADLRFFEPFPALRDWLDAHDPTAAAAAVSADSPRHLPWIAILYHALRRLRATCGDPRFTPRTSDDYARLRGAVASLVPRGGGSAMPEGFAEALGKCRAALNRTRALPAAAQAVLQKSPGDAREPQWAVARGIRRFIDAHGVPPLCGCVKDMATSTQWYRELCTIYAEKRDADCAEVCAYAMDALRVNEGPEPDHSVIAELTLAMVTNLWTLQVLRFEPVFCRDISRSNKHSNGDQGKNDKGDIAPPTLLQDSRFQQYFDECSSPQEWFTVALFAALLAARCFEEQMGRPSGRNYSSDIHSNRNTNSSCNNADVLWLADAEALQRIIGAAFETNGRKRERGGCSEYIHQACAEVARAGAGEPAVTAIVMGAVAAQECIKLVQHRRVPVNRPLVFDGYRNCFWLAPQLRDM